MLPPDLQSSRDIRSAVQGVCGLLLPATGCSDQKRRTLYGMASAVVDAMWSCEKCAGTWRNVAEAVQTGGCHHDDYLLHCVMCTDVDTVREELRDNGIALMPVSVVPGLSEKLARITGVLLGRMPAPEFELRQSGQGATSGSRRVARAGSAEDLSGRFRVHRV